jgi:hypothetical protein
MWIGDSDAGGSAMMPEEGSETGGCHALPAGGPLQRDEKRRTTGIGPFQSHVVFKQLNGFRSQGEKSQLASFAANTQLSFGKEHIIRVQAQDLRGPESLQEHKTDYGEVTGGAKTGPESSHLIDR